MNQLSRIVGVVASIHPILQDEVSALIEEWSPDAPPINISMSAFGKATVRDAERLGREQVRKILDLVEHALSYGTEEEKDAVATGFLEAAASAAGSSRDARWIFALLGPKARAYLAAWDGFCGLAED